MAVTPSRTTSGYFDPRRKCRTEHRLIVDLLADTEGKPVVALGYGCSSISLNDPKGWSTLPKLIVYHLDKTLTGQLAEIGLKTTDITYVALSHSHGDRIIR